jgi:hypothetical protein
MRLSNVAGFQCQCNVCVARFVPNDQIEKKGDDTARGTAGGRKEVEDE